MQSDAPHVKLARAAELEAEAAKLRQEAFNERPLPDVWRVGQIVRTLSDKEFAWGKGALMYINEIRSEYKGTPADRYQVFYTSFVGKDKSSGTFWTTPEDVEFVSEAKNVE